MARKATKKDLVGALGELTRYLPDDLALEQYGQRFRIIRHDHSRPLGANYYSKDVLYDMIWAMVEVLRMANVERRK